MKVRTFFMLLTGFMAMAPAARAELTRLPPVQVTATRDAESIELLPASVTVVTGDELRARGANDLRSALAFVAGVEGTPTGDGGPAGSVPALWGLREVDAFLLVIDGVPAGGAFNPLTPQIDLTGVERIEVLRGAAPVMYGATSFNGVIHIIHYAAGETPGNVAAGVGSEGSYNAAYYGTLSSEGWRQSLTANIEKRGFSVDRMESRRYHALYRAASGGFHLDGEVSVVPQKPGSTTFRNGANLRTDLVPEDANHNPSDAKMDQHRYMLTAGYDAATGLGNWGSTLAVSSTKDEIVRGFHRAANSSAANGYEQEREILDVYFDTHVVQPLSPAFKLTWGLDALFGQGKQEAFRFPYAVGVDGSNPQDSSSARAACVPSNPDECVEFGTEVERTFAGVYVQSEWALTPSFNLLAGLRLNQTEEKQEGEDEITMTTTTVKQTNTKVSGTLGGAWTAWHSGNDSFGLFADYRHSFKPVAAELAPEPGVRILKPETADSYEVGLRGALADGRVQYDASLFRLNFKNLKTKVVDPGSGNVVDGNAGGTRFQGGEAELRYAVFEALQVVGNYAYHDSRFIHFNRDTSPTTVAAVDGNRFEVSPFHLAGVGLIYAPARGFTASAGANHTGSRKLNKSNSLQVGSFTTIDASLGWNFGAFSLMATGQNLTDRRDFIAESELSEEISGASSYYRNPGVRYMLNFAMAL